MHFAISILHVLVLQVLPSAAHLQPEPEGECLLQTQAQQAHQVALKSDQTVSNPENLCPAGTPCRCPFQSAFVWPPPSLTITECQDFCRLFPAFQMIQFVLPSGTPGPEECSCCVAEFIETDLDPSTTSQVYKGVGLPSFPGALQELSCGTGNCECVSPAFPPNYNIDQLFNVDTAGCANWCYAQTPRLLNFQFNTGRSPSAVPSSTCTCCASSAVQGSRSQPPGQVFSINPSANLPGGALGDPHITTLDGHHYTLLKQGTFVLWRLSGLSTDFQAHDGMLKKAPIDWRIFTRYSGQQAFTKGVLVVDQSGGSARQVLEMTSNDCQWRARKAGTEWTTVKDDEIIAVPDDEDFATGFRVTKNGARGHNHVRFEVNTMGGKMDKAILSLSCRPHHHINLQLVMKNRSDYAFIEGELKVARGGISTLQTDSEFAVDTKWEDLGGSHWAASYFKVDEEAVALDGFSSRCSKEEETAAHEMCLKHVGNHRVDDQTFFTDCVYDVCHGAGEIAAELAAELLASTLAIEGA